MNTYSKETIEWIAKRLSESVEATALILLTHDHPKHQVAQKILNEDVEERIQRIKSWSHLRQSYSELLALVEGLPRRTPPPAPNRDSVNLNSKTIRWFDSLLVGTMAVRTSRLEATSPLPTPAQPIRLSSETQEIYNELYRILAGRPGCTLHLTKLGVDILVDKRELPREIRAYISELLPKFRAQASKDGICSSIFLVDSSSQRI